MKSDRSIFLAGVVLSIAVGAGSVMQGGDGAALDLLPFHGTAATASFAAIAEPAQPHSAVNMLRPEAADPALQAPSLPKDPVVGTLVAPPPRGLATRIEAISNAGDDLGTLVAMQARLSPYGLP